jgi:hypothetical protein
MAVVTGAKANRSDGAPVRKVRDKGRNAVGFCPRQDGDYAANSDDMNRSQEFPHPGHQWVGNPRQVQNACADLKRPGRLRAPPTYVSVIHAIVTGTRRGSLKKVPQLAEATIRATIEECQTEAWVSKVKRSATERRKRRAIRSKVSNEGAFLPRSMRLRKSTEMPSVSANSS